MLTLSRTTYQPMNLEQLRQVPITEVGNRTSRWKGIQHAELAEEIERTVTQLTDTVPMKSQYIVSPNGATLIGGFELAKKPDWMAANKPAPKGWDGSKLEPYTFPCDPGTGVSLGYWHGNDSQKALRILVGGRVFLCENGIVTGAVDFRRRHTKNLRLREFLQEGLADFLPNLETQYEERIMPLTEEPMTSRKHERGMVEMGRQNIIPWRLMGRFDRLWTRATSGEGIGWIDPDSDWDPDSWDFGANKWDFYGAQTHIIKQLPPAQQLISLGKALDFTTAL